MAVASEDWLALGDAELLAQCRFDRFRVSGPGGQHRNRRDTAVRLVHTPSGVSAQASERRSQAQNRQTALARLRRAIALELRRPVSLDAYHPPPALQRILPGKRQQVGPSAPQRVGPSARQRVDPGAPHRVGPGERQRIGPRHPDFWAGAQHLLDLFDAQDASLADTAAAIGCSTNQLAKTIAADPHLLQQANHLRHSRNLPPLRP